MRIVDIHPHVVSPDTDAYPRARLDGALGGWPAMPSASFDKYLEAMDDAGIAKAAIVHSSTTYGFDNSYVAAAVAAHPDRFTGVFTVDMLADDAAEAIRHWAIDRGLGGLRLFTAGSAAQATWLSDPQSFRAWDAAADLGIPVCVQMWMSGLPHLRILLDRYRQVPIIVDHFLGPPLEAGPPYADAEPLLSLVRHPNVHLKLTPIVVRNASQGRAKPETYLPRVIREFGAARIAWGSNFPSSGPSLGDLLAVSRKALDWASPDEQAWIFHRTAEALYPAVRP